MSAVVTFESMIARGPGDPDWKKGGLYDDSMGWGVPALWFNSWYDVSIGPNMALYNHARSVNSDREASANQYVVVGPNPHCQFARLGKDYKVGDRQMGDASFPVNQQIFGFFDRWLKNQPKAFAADTPHVRYFTMGLNKWQSDAQWPPKAAKPVRMYLHSGGDANSMFGDGVLSFEAPVAGQADILIAAAGVPGLVTVDFVKPGAAVIDIGINQVTGPGGEVRSQSRSIPVPQHTAAPPLSPQTLTSVLTRPETPDTSGIGTGTVSSPSWSTP